MSTLLAPTTADPLAPVRDTLLAQARQRAAQVLAAADAEAALALATARTEAEAMTRRARQQGEADAAAALADLRARARRRARATVLAAHQAAYDGLRRQVRLAVAALRDDPGFPAVRDRLADDVRRVLGPDAVVCDRPDGGVVAEVGGRRASTGLVDAAERVLDEMGPEVEQLWAP